MPTAPRTKTAPAPTVPRGPRLMTTHDLAELLQITTDSVKRMRTDGTGPKFINLGRSRLVRYQPRDVQDWLDAGKRTSTKD